MEGVRGQARDTRDSGSRGRALHGGKGKQRRGLRCKVCIKDERKAASRLMDEDFFFFENSQLYQYIRKLDRGGRQA
jgi:hypothetical protein